MSGWFCSLSHLRPFQGGRGDITEGLFCMLAFCLQRDLIASVAGSLLSLSRRGATTSRLSVSEEEKTMCMSWMILSLSLVVMY